MVLETEDEDEVGRSRTRYAAACFLFLVCRLSVKGRASETRRSKAVYCQNRAIRNIKRNYHSQAYMLTSTKLGRTLVWKYTTAYV